MQEPSDKERRRLAGGDRLLSQLLSTRLASTDITLRLDGATRIEVWETATPSQDVQVTVMEFDDAGLALRARIFDNFTSAQQWLKQP